MMNMCGFRYLNREGKASRVTNRGTNSTVLRTLGLVYRLLMIYHVQLVGVSTIRSVQKPLGEEAVNRKEKPQINALEDTNGEEEAPVVVGADPVEVP
ncbi:hypothetical protein KC19_7G082100 [Ceratodon purpureus]|uniref:Uncharacterized protein n=1 Tax=Ceratodon purpureus TaxID=3225 RepID=A0A8T0H7N2_CERPU|nr:hypothetical protein KC19_7G082100 [Ceratodon purpureus]